MPPRRSMLLRRGTGISRYSTRVDRKRQMLDRARGGGARRTDAPLRLTTSFPFPSSCTHPLRCPSAVCPSVAKGGIASLA
eukprot:scaffold1949_cov348-Pavlova_lutheri.AAC.17